MSFNSLGAFEPELIAKQLVESVSLLRQVEQIGDIYRDALFHVLTPLSDTAQRRLLKNFYNSDCPYVIKSKLIGKNSSKNPNSYLLTESDRLFNKLTIEMTEKGTHFRDKQTWEQLQHELVTEETLKHLEYPFTLCSKLKIAHPQALNLEYTYLIKALCKHKLSLRQTDTIFEEISHSKRPGDLIELIVEVLNTPNRIITVEAIGTSQLRVSLKKIIATIHLFNMLTNPIELPLLESLQLSLFWRLAELSDPSYKSIKRAFQHFPQISGKMLETMFDLRKANRIEWERKFRTKWQLKMKTKVKKSKNFEDCNGFIKTGLIFDKELLTLVGIIEYLLLKLL